MPLLLKSSKGLFFIFLPLNIKSMLYTITIIRLNAETKVFENTEHHGIVLVGDLRAEFERRNIPSEHLDLVLDMKGGAKTVEVQTEDKIWFIYVCKIS